MSPKCCISLAVASALVISLALAVSGAPTNANTKYTGEWLASELGLDSRETIEQAMSQLRDSRAPTEQDFSEGQSVSAELLEGAHKMRQSSPGGAIELAKELIKQAKAQLEETKSPQQKRLLTQFLFSIQLDKVRAHQADRQLFEALLEGLRARTLCNDENLCTGQQLHSLNTLTHYIEQVIKTSPPEQVLNLNESDLTDPAKVRSLRRKIRARLHPDKNLDLDKENTATLERLYDLANKTYEQLLTTRFRK